MVLPIIKIPSPILRTRSREVAREELRKPEIQKLIGDMRETMPAANGIGLAAPQVGVNVRIAVIAYEKKMLTVVNPKIVKRQPEYQDSEEGCLSIPDVVGIVPRYKEIKVTSFDEQGRRFNMRVRGLLACVWQHEIDHLDGILFVDRAVKFLAPVTEEQRKAFAAYKL